MLLAGAAADDTPSVCGALSFIVNDSPLWAFWFFGSAFICSLLVRVLVASLPLVALLRLLWTILRQIRGAAVPLQYKIPISNLGYRDKNQELIIFFYFHAVSVASALDENVLFAVLT